MRKWWGYTEGIRFLIPIIFVGLVFLVYLGFFT